MRWLIDKTKRLFGKLPDSAEERRREELERQRMFYARLRALKRSVEVLAREKTL